VNTAFAPAHIERETASEMIARVLKRVHGTMEALDSPDEARAILHVAHSFADELAMLDPFFDRLRFIREVTEERV
jgi:hypothetical protein